MVIWRTASYPLTSQATRPSGSSARNTGRPPLIVVMSGRGWPGRAGVNLTGPLSTLIIGTPHRDRYCDGNVSLTHRASSWPSGRYGPSVRLREYDVDASAMS